MQRPPAVHRFTNEDYHAMGEAGILPHDLRVELIDGQIVEMSPLGRRHAAAVDRLNRMFVLAFRESAIVRVQGPLKLPPFSEPQPDLLVLAERTDYYAAGGPFAGDTLLAVEVADSSLRFDMKVKAPLYAREGIPELWIVDLTRDRLLVYRFGESASQPQEVRSGLLAPVRAPAYAFDVAEILSTARESS
ncbi:MAG: Uma2 family endonuclease [Vulcanimicrobiaceae bacterium]